MAGEGTDVGRIIGYLLLDRSDWDQGLDAAGRKADELGRKSPKIRIDTNAPEAIAALLGVEAAEKRVGDGASQAKPFVMNLWAALAAAAPAAIPIAGVLGGALIGLLPVLAVVGLGIAGISNQLKAGAQQGTQFAADVASLKGELTTLERTAAGGLLSGLNQAMASSGPLFKTFNGDIGVMSGQLGHIVGSAAPALLAIFTQLNPLFVTFGNLLVRGAGELEHWATSTNGIHSFVAYVQTELPQVMQFLGNLVVLIGHIVQAAAPMGGVMLTGFGTLVRLLDELPISVLQVMVPLLVAGYTALKAYQGIDAIVNGVTSSVTKMTNALGLTGPKAAAAAAATKAALLEEQSAFATNAASIAITESNKAEDVARSSAAIAASLAGTGSILEAESAAAAEAAAEYSAAMATEAEAAFTTAAEISVAAAAASESVNKAGTAARAGWASMLGPIGAVAIGLSILVSAFGSHSAAAQKATQSTNDYSQALQQNANVLADVNVAETAKQLQQSKSFNVADQLNQQNAGLSLSYGDLILAVNGTQDQYQSLITTLHSVADANIAAEGAGAASRAGEGANVTAYNATGRAALGLIGTVTNLRNNLSAAEKQQAALAQAQKDAQVAIDGGTTAVADQAKQYGVTADAYLTAQQAAQKNTAQTSAQTQAFQLENNAIGLVQNALNGLAGVNASVLGAQTSLASATNSAITSFQQNGAAVKGNTASAVANQQALQGNYQAATQLAEAIGKQTGSSAAATKSMVDSKKALEDQLAAQGKLTPAVQAYIDKLYDLKDLKVPPTQIDVDKATADAKIAAFQKEIANLHGKTITISADNSNALNAIVQVGNAIYRLTNQGAEVDIKGSAGVTTRAKAYGGTIPGAAFGATVGGIGGDRSDNQLWRLSPKEEVTPMPWAEKYRPALKAIGSGRFDQYMAAHAPASGGGGVSSAQIAAVASAAAKAAAAEVMAGLPAIVLQADKKELARTVDRGNRLLGVGR